MEGGGTMMQISPRPGGQEECGKGKRFRLVIFFPWGSGWCGLLVKGLASQCKAQEKYKERLDLGLTWLKWLPTGMESKTRLAPRSNKVNSQKLTLDWNTSLCYRVIWKWHQSAFHANNHAIGGGSNGIIHLGWRPHTFLLHTNIDSTNSNTNRTNITEMAFKRFPVEIRLLLLKKCSHWKRWSTITSTGRTD